MGKAALVIGGAVAFLLAAPAADAKKGHSNKGSVIIAEGFSAPNDYPAHLLPQVFHDWCNACVPTVKLDVVDPKKGDLLGFIYAWGQNFGGSADGNSINFHEFIIFDLNGGQLYTVSRAPGHPGGAFADPTIVPPKQGDLVLLGGAEGEVVGGTGKYRHAGGPYSTRLKVEVDFASGNFVYYDELYFRFREVFVK